MINAVNSIVNFKQLQEDERRYKDAQERLHADIVISAFCKSLEERSLIKHTKFLIKELLATLKCLEKADFTDELKEEMRNLSQEMINVTL